MGACARRPSKTASISRLSVTASSDESSAISTRSTRSLTECWPARPHRSGCRRGASRRSGAPVGHRDLDRLDSAKTRVRPYEGSRRSSSGRAAGRRRAERTRRGALPARPRRGSGGRRRVGRRVHFLSIERMKKSPASGRRHPAVCPSVRSPPHATRYRRLWCSAPARPVAGRGRSHPSGPTDPPLPPAGGRAADRRRHASDRGSVRRRHERCP